MRDRLSLCTFAMLAACSSRAEPAPAAPANPFAAHALPSAEQRWREGRVVERLSAGPYVYLRLRESSGRSSWLVSLRVTTPPADDVRALVVGHAEHFRSKRLDREFSPLAFAAVRSADPESP